MIFIGILIVLFIVVNLLFFISRSLSPIPFFPTSQKDLPLIITSLLKTKSDVVIDMGAGTGTVIFPTALEAFKQKNKTQFYAVEIHPLLIMIMHMKRFAHPNKKNIHILREDLFKLSSTDFKSPTSNFQLPTSIYLYVGPFVMTRLKPVLETFPVKTNIVSYMYRIPGWEKRLQNTVKGRKELYIYTI